MKHIKPLSIIVFLVSFFIFFPKIIDQITKPEGRPVSFNVNIVESDETILYSIDRLDPYNKAGQELKSLWGWSFLGDASSQLDYDIYISLQSDRNIYTYETEILPRPDLNDAFPEVESDLAIAGFITYLAEEFISPGNYNILIIYQNRETGRAFYQPANKIIVRTPNKLFLEIKQ